MKDITDIVRVCGSVVLPGLNHRLINCNTLASLPVRFADDRIPGRFISQLPIPRCGRGEHVVLAPERHLNGIALTRCAQGMEGAGVFAESMAVLRMYQLIEAWGQGESLSLQPVLGQGVLICVVAARGYVMHARLHNGEWWITTCQDRQISASPGDRILMQSHPCLT